MERIDNSERVNKMPEIIDASETRATIRLPGGREITYGCDIDAVPNPDTIIQIADMSHAHRMDEPLPKVAVHIDKIARVLAVREILISRKTISESPDNISDAAFGEFREQKRAGHLKKDEMTEHDKEEYL
jgi:hypothetical protein